MDKGTINGHLRRDFWPLVAADGFVRRGEVARRIDLPVVHVVQLVHRPRAGVFRVDLGVHLVSLGDAAGKAIDPETLREPGCAWRSSVVAGLTTDASAFAYGATEEQASESVAFLASMWPRESEQFFGPLQSWPEQFHARARETLAGFVHPADMLTWAQVAALTDDLPLARQIAEAALPNVPDRATSLRASLEAIRDDPHAGVPDLR